MISKSRGLIALEKQSAESWKEGIERGQDRVQRARALCRVMVNAGEDLDQDDREIGSALIDDLLQKAESEFAELVRFFSFIDRVGLNSITIKKRAAQEAKPQLKEARKQNHPRPVLVKMTEERMREEN